MTGPSPASSEALLVHGRGKSQRLPLLPRARDQVCATCSRDKAEGRWLSTGDHINAITNGPLRAYEQKHVLMRAVASFYTISYKTQLTPFSRRQNPKER